MFLKQRKPIVAALARAVSTGATVAPKFEQLPPGFAVFCPFSGRLDDHSERRAIDDCFKKISSFIDSHRLRRARGALRTVYIKAFNEDTATTSGEAAINIRDGA